MPNSELVNITAQDGQPLVTPVEARARARSDFAFWQSGGVAYTGSILVLMLVIESITQGFNLSPYVAWALIPAVSFLIPSFAWHSVLLRQARERILTEKLSESNELRKRSEGRVTELQSALDKQGSAHEAEVAELKTLNLPDLKFNLLRIELGTANGQHAIFVRLRVRNWGHATSLVDWQCSTTNRIQERGLPPNGEGELASPTDWRVLDGRSLSPINTDDQLVSRIGAGTNRGHVYEGWLAFVGFEYPELQHFGEVCVICQDTFDNPYRICRRQLTLFEITGDVKDKLEDEQRQIQEFREDMGANDHSDPSDDEKNSK